MSPPERPGTVAGMIRTHIGHIALRASDPETSASFLSDILGLRRTIVTDDEVMLSCNEKHHEVQLLAGAEPGVDHLGLEVEDERDLDQVRDRLIAAGAHMPPLARRLGHVSFAAPDCQELQRFFTDVLDLRVSDTLSGRITWLRCNHEHHAIALVNAGGAPKMHHYAFQLESWGAIERYADSLALLGRQLIWGPGRHGPGRNIYTYVPDPDNAIVEAYADMLEISSEADYRPIDWTDRGDSALNLWGPMAPSNWRDYGVPIL
jgi:catechol 2,3-dioxygenase